MTPKDPVLGESKEKPAKHVGDTGRRSGKGARERKWHGWQTRSVRPRHADGDERPDHAVDGTTMPPGGSGGKVRGHRALPFGEHGPTFGNQVHTPGRTCQREVGVTSKGGARTARMAGTGSFLPPHAQDNRELFALKSIQEAFDVERARNSLRDHADAGALEPVDVFDHWARQVTGIRERRVVCPGDGITTEIMCARAAEAALDRAELEASDVDLIVVASVSPADNVPNAACTVGQMLGVPRVGGYTLNGACTGFVHAVASAYGFIAGGMADTVLAMAGDTLTRITDFGDPTTAVLFSDGAAAAVLTASDTPGILGPPVLQADYAREHLFIVGQGWESEEDPEPKLRMGGGPRVLRRAIQAMENVAARALDAAEVGWDSVTLVIPHQANLRITRGLESQLELPRGRVIHTIERYGNCSGATVGIALDEALRGIHGPVEFPARVVLTAVGGGYTTAAAVMDIHRDGEGGRT